MDGGIESYGSADVLANLHRGDEVQVTCDSASRMGYLQLKNCDFEVLHPAGGFDTDIGYLAVNMDHNGGAIVAAMHRSDTPSEPEAASQADSAAAADHRPVPTCLRRLVTAERQAIPAVTDQGG